MKALQTVALAIGLSLLAIGSVGAQPGLPTRRNLPARPAPITAADASHIVAYYRKAQNTLFIFDQKALARGIERGVYRLTWRPGASKATLTLLVDVRTVAGRREAAVPVRVTANVVYAESSGGLVGKETQLGDTQMVKDRNKVDVAEDIRPCDNGSKFVQRGYRTLKHDGDKSGTETLIVKSRDYEYEVKTCARGFLKYDNPAEGWALDWDDWPNP